MREKQREEEEKREKKRKIRKFGELNFGIKKECPLPGLGWVRKFIEKDTTSFLFIVLVLF
ncbi:hypothetical protein LguiB_016670 [Lonicera macranthoides]